MDRLRPAAEMLETGKYELAPIDWSEVNKRQTAEKDKALAWLQKAIAAPKAAAPSAETRLLTHLSRQITLLNMEGSQAAMLLAVLDYPRVRRRYWRYKLLSKITFGKTRKKYKEKRKKLKQKLKQVRKFRKINGSAFWK